MKREDLERKEVRETQRAAKFVLCSLRGSFGWANPKLDGRTERLELGASSAGQENRAAKTALDQRTQPNLNSNRISGRCSLSSFELSRWRSWILEKQTWTREETSAAVETSHKNSEPDSEREHATPEFGSCQTNEPHISLRLP